MQPEPSPIWHRQTRAAVVIKADLHVHTDASPDSDNKPEAIVARCQQRGITCVAITDHNTMARVAVMQALAPFLVVPGEEIATTQGEIIGLFLQEEIPRGLNPLEVARRIKEQGGLVYIPHPFDRLRKSVIKPAALKEVLPLVDAIEAFNSRTTLLRDSRRARALALERNLPMGAGSDGHTLPEIGNAYVELPEFDGPQQFLQALTSGQVLGRRSNPIVHLATTWTKLRKRRAARRRS